MPIWRQLCCPSCSTATSGLGTTTVSPGPAPLDSLRARSASYDATVAALERAGLPVVDHIRGTLPVTTEAVEPGYRTLVEELPAGVTHFALHCTAPGDVEGITPQHAPWRTNEYALFASGAVAKWCAALGIEAVGYRDIQRLWLRDR
jgi:hypothetical protein